MWNLDLRPCLLALTCLIAVAQPTPPPPPAPTLLPGEGMAIGVDGGKIGLYGESQREYPMGSLAKLVWLDLEGIEWASSAVEYKCTGTDGGHTCWLKKGHGKVDLEKALRLSCNLAFLKWTQLSVDEWKYLMGEGAGRLRLEEGFRPFLGGRMPPGDEIPPMSPAWIGDGDLLRTSPEQMLLWLMDPKQSVLVSRCKRFLLTPLGKNRDWWVKTGTAPVPGAPGETSAWVAGSNGQLFVVLHLPRGRGKAEGLERFCELMGLHVK